MKKTLVFILLSFLAASCGDTSSSSQSSAQVSELNILINDLKLKNSSRGLKWQERYSDAVVEALQMPENDGLFEAKILERDLNRLGCRNFNELSKQQKTIFYIVYMAAIAEAESDFRTALKTLNPSDMTTNVGMLQIDQRAANNHTKGALGIIDEQDLTNPETNLKAGVFILKNQVRGKIAQNRLLTEKSYYWQVLTYPTRLLKNIENNRSNLPFCRK